MASPLRIPEYATTGGTYWPASGTIPKANTSTYYVITRDTAGTDLGYKIQAASNPGVDPLNLDTLPKLIPQRWIYIPSLGTLHQLAFVRGLVDTAGTTATVTFMPGNTPTALVANTPTAFTVIDTGAKPLLVRNIGAATATINGANFVAGQEIIVTGPVTYDQGASTLSLAIRW